jgi:RNase P protein component
MVIFSSVCTIRALCVDVSWVNAESASSQSPPLDVGQDPRLVDVWFYPTRRGTETLSCGTTIRKKKKGKESDRHWRKRRRREPVMSEANFDRPLKKILFSFAERCAWNSARSVRIARFLKTLRRILKDQRLVKWPFLTRRSSAPTKWQKKKKQKRFACVDPLTDQQSNSLIFIEMLVARPSLLLLF